MHSFIQYVSIYGVILIFYVVYKYIQIHIYISTYLHASTHLRDKEHTRARCEAKDLPRPVELVRRMGGETSRGLGPTGDLGATNPWWVVVGQMTDLGGETSLCFIPTIGGFMIQID